MTGLRKILNLTLAAGFFLLAVVGIVLPGLPTTPFLLLTSYFLVRSYPQLNEVLLKSRLFGGILTDWQIRGGVRRDVKIKAVCCVVLAMGFSVYASGAELRFSAAMAILACVGVGVVVKLPEAKS